MILGHKKSDVEKILGRSLMASPVLGIQGEKAEKYSLGDGMDIVVGFVDSIARWFAVVRKQGPNNPFSPSEIAAALTLTAPAALWTSSEFPKPPAKPSKSDPVPTTYFSFVERDPKNKEKVLREVLGWKPAKGKFLFFYEPAITGEMPIIPNEWSVNSKFA